MATLPYKLILGTVQIKELVKKNEGFQISLRDSY